MSNRNEDVIAWLRRAGSPDWRTSYQYSGVPLERMDREALIGLIFVQSRAIAREAERALRTRTKDDKDERSGYPG